MHGVECYRVEYTRRGRVFLVEYCCRINYTTLAFTTGGFAELKDGLNLKRFGCKDFLYIPTVFSEGVQRRLTWQFAGDDAIGRLQTLHSYVV